MYNYEMNPIECEMNAIRDATIIWKRTGRSKVIPVTVSEPYYNDAGIAIGYSSTHGVEVLHFEEVSNYGDNKWVKEDK